MIYNESSDLHCLIICFIEKDAYYRLPMNFFFKNMPRFTFFVPMAKTCFQIKRATHMDASVI